MGLYGPIVIDPAGADPVAYDREHVVVLADHSAMSPTQFSRSSRPAKAISTSRSRRSPALLAGKDQTLEDRLQWGEHADGARRTSPT